MNARAKAILLPMLWYLLLFGAVYYLVPIPPTVAGNADFYRTTLLLLNPMTCFVAAIAFSARRGFAWYFPLLAGGLFGPSIPIFYGQTALVYLFAYVVLSFIGAGVGYSVYQDRNKNNG